MRQKQQSYLFENQGKGFEYCRFVMNALKAKEFYRRDVQYIVRNGKALIINEVFDYITND